MSKHRRKTRRKLRKSRLSKTNIILSIILVAFCGVAAWVFYEVLNSGTSDDWFEKNATNNAAISLPEDDGPHQVARESWVFNGYLQSETKELYSFHYTVFLVNDLVTHMISHVSVNDHQSGMHYTAQRKTVWNSFANTKNQFEFIHGNWFMMGGDGNDRLKVVADDFKIDLSAISNQAPMLHGEQGIISFAGSGDDYYYSRPRMITTGTLSVGETTKNVTGISWFDHQWGEFLIGSTTKAWFALQLNNGMDIMIYQLGDNFVSPAHYFGTISHDGISETILDTDLTITSEEKWISDKSKISYPMTWTIHIPKKNISLKIQAISKNNEFDATLTSYDIYWKGPVKVKGSHTGLGFMELNSWTRKVDS